MLILEQDNKSYTDSTFKSIDTLKKFQDKYTGIFTKLSVTRYIFGGDNNTKKEHNLYGTVEDVAGLVQDQSFTSMSLYYEKQGIHYTFTVTFNQLISQCSTVTLTCGESYDKDLWDMLMDLLYGIGYQLVMISFRINATSPSAVESYKKIGFKDIVELTNRRTSSRIKIMVKKLESCL